MPAKEKASKIGSGVITAAKKNPRDAGRCEFGRAPMAGNDARFQIDHTAKTRQTGDYAKCGITFSAKVRSDSLTISCGTVPRSITRINSSTPAALKRPTDSLAA
jgi:hypothetical protein